MRRWLGRRSTLILLTIVILAVAQFRFFQPIRDSLRGAVSGPSQIVGGIGQRIKLSFSILFTVNDLARENTELRELMLLKEAEIAKLEFARGENDQLKKDLEFKLGRSDFNSLAATVINYSPTSIYQTITINRGSSDGVAVGQAAVSSGFLIGKVNKVSERTAEIWLLSNRNLVTPVMLTESQTVGLLKGSIRGLVVENIPLDTKVEKGSPVVTSALEGLYPAGIAIGAVEEVISAKEEIFLTLRISSPVNPSNLTSVLVVRQ